MNYLVEVFMNNRVVITGMGVVSSLGIGKDAFWQSIKAGKCGISNIERIDVSDLPTKVGAEIKDFNPGDFIEKKEIKRMDRFAHYAMAASKLAVEDSGLDTDNIDKNRAGVIIGSGIGGIEVLESQYRVLKEKGPGRISPFIVPMLLPNMASGLVAIQNGFKGHNESVITACATSTNSIGDSYKVIQRGDADIMIAGGTEAPFTRLVMAGFCSSKTMSTSLDPLDACKPFDLERDGFVMGEGAGVVILEEYNHAVKRGAKIIAEVVGYGSTNDAYHITAPAEGGEGAARCMQVALDDAGIKPSDIGYINAHGTSTSLNDKNETAAVKTVFKDHAYKLFMSSTKSMTGHLLGGAGGIEAIITSLALKEGFLPPTINYKNQDPDCDLNYLPNEGRYQKVKYAISNSLGFGGHNASLVFKAMD